MNTKKPSYNELEKKLLQTEKLVAKLKKAKAAPVKTKRPISKFASNIDFSNAQELAEAYRASEQNFKNSMDASPLGIRIVTDDGKLIYANQAILDICGYQTAEQMAAVPHRELYTPESYQAYQERKRKRKLNEYVPPEYEIGIRRPDGEVRNLQVHRREVMWGGEQQFMAMYEDITESKRAQEALRESEEKFHNIVEHSNDGIVFIQNGIIQYCNSKLLEIGSYRENDLIGKPFIDFVATEHKQMVADYYSQRIAGKNVQERYELNLLAKDGRKIYTEISASLVSHKQEQVLIAIVRDVTGRKKAEEALAGEAVRRRILVEQSRDGIVILDQDGNVCESNQRFADMLGYSMEEMKQLHVFDWEFQYPKEQVVEMIRTVDEKGDHFETRHRRKDGTTYDVEISTNGAMFAGQKLIFCVCRDITERKQMEKTLEESGAKYRSIYENSNDAIFLTYPDGRILAANAAACKMFGKTEEEIINSDRTDITDPSDPRLKQALEIRRKTGEYTGELTFLRADGTKFPGFISSKIFLDKDGKEKTSLIVHDITQRKRMEEALRLSEEMFSKAFQASPAINAITTLKEGTFVDINDAYTQSTGFSRDEIIGKDSTSLNSWVNLKDRDRMLNILKEKGRIDKEEFDFRMKSGEIRTWLLSAEPITFGGEECLLGVSLDITERKQTQEALERERKDIKLILDTTPALVWYKNLDGKLLRVNKAFADAIKIPEEDFIGKTVFDLYSRDIAQSMTDDDNEVIKSGLPKLNIVEQYESAAGLRWVQTDKIPALDNNGKPTAIIGFAQDITALKQAEQALKSREEFLDNIIEKTPNALWVSDEKGTVIRMNQALRDLLHVTKKEVVGKYNVLQDKQVIEQGLLPLVKSVFEEGKTVNFVIDYFTAKEEQVKPAQSTHKILEITMSAVKDKDGKVINAICQEKDVTERQLAEQRINYLNHTLRSIRNVNQLITREKDRSKLLQGICDTLVESRSFFTAWIALLNESQQLVLQAVSGPYADIVKLTEEFQKGNLPQCVQKALKKTQVITTEDPQTVCVGCPILTDSNVFGSMTVRLEYEGRVYGVLCASLPKAILADKSEANLFHEVASDIAFALYNIEREVEYELLEQERLRAAKMESIGTLAGGIAHDFNNLLTGIMGNIGMVKSSLSPTDTIYEMLDEAEKAAIRSKDLTQQLLTFARGGKPIKKTAEIGNIVKEAATFALRGSNAKLELSLPEDLWTIEADEGQINQVINNLAINADEAMAGGGTLKIQVKNITLKKLEIPPLPGGDYVIIDVADTGIGISHEHLQMIFEPYFTTKQRGSGLGLTTAYSIVRNHGGTIIADSTRNKGSTFHIYLPAIKKPTKGGKKMTAKSSGQAGGKVLVMDDEEMIRKMLKNMLTLAGYLVEFSTDGTEALEKYQAAQKKGYPFDVVIIDLTIPGGMGGKETIKKLLEIDPEATAIVSSGYANDPIMSEYKKYGFKSVIAKPYSIKQLQEALSMVISNKKNKGLT